MARLSYPDPPISSLPPLSLLHTCSTDRIEHALLNLHAIYRSRALLDISTTSRTVPNHKIHDLSVPDSGYASAEEDEPEHSPDEGEDSDVFDLDVLRSDPLERDFTIRWLTAFAGRSDAWAYDPALPEEEEKRARLVDDAASLLASFASEGEEVDVTRTFAFACAPGSAHGLVEVELNDAPLLTEDHTSVGLQSWGSSIILAEQMCATPDVFGLCLSPIRQKLRVLELGAGTGLLSIAVRKLLQSPNSEIVATDYHPSVLRNLEANIATNFPLSTCRSSVAVSTLDWQNPAFDEPLHMTFDVILAADVIYQPEHAQWIKNCIQRLLRRPNHLELCTEEPGRSIFWLIIPVRSTGRHEGMGSTVEAVFPRLSVKGNTKICVAEESMELAILSARRMGKHDGVGRADESGYTLFEIGWVPSSLL